MPLPVKVFSSDDAGAPQFATSMPKPSEFIAALKACLVDGYGTSTSLGWTVAAEDAVNFKIAFKNSVADGGTGSFLVCESVGGTDTANGRLSIYSCRDFTDFTSMGKKGKSNAIGGDSNQTKWFLIGTSRAFYFYANNKNRNVMYLSSYNVPSFFAGDIDSVFPNDQGAFVCVSNLNNNNDTITASWNYNFTYLGSAAKGAIDKIYDVDGFDHSADYYTQFPMETFVTDIPDEPDITSSLSRIAVCRQSPSFADRNGVKVINSVVEPHLRGWLPGLMQLSSGGFSKHTWPLERDFNGVTHRAFATYGVTVFWFNLGTWYD